MRTFCFFFVCFHSLRASKLQPMRRTHTDLRTTNRVNSLQPMRSAHVRNDARHTSGNECATPTPALRKSISCGRNAQVDVVDIWYSKGLGAHFLEKRCRFPHLIGCSSFLEYLKAIATAADPSEGKNWSNFEKTNPGWSSIGMLGMFQETTSLYPSFHPTLGMF